MKEHPRTPLSLKFVPRRDELTSASEVKSADVVMADLRRIICEGLEDKIQAGKCHRSSDALVQLIGPALTPQLAQSWTQALVADSVAPSDVLFRALGKELTPTHWRIRGHRLWLLAVRLPLTCCCVLWGRS